MRDDTDNTGVPDGSEEDRSTGMCTVEVHRQGNLYDTVEDHQKNEEGTSKVSTEKRHVN